MLLQNLPFVSIRQMWLFMCVSPITITFKGDTRRVRESCGLPVSLLVPCGRCSECLKKRATSWGVRAYREFLFAPAGSVRFVTITYDDKHIPVTSSGNQTLSSEDCKAFLKAFRQSLFRKYGVTIRFMCAGEYGSKTFRPHYHFLFYGIPTFLTNVELRHIIGSAWHRCSVIDVQFPKNGNSSGFYVGKYMAKSGYARAYAIKRADPYFVMPFKRASIGFGNQFSRSEIAYYLAEDVSNIPAHYTPPTIDFKTYTIGDLFEDPSTPETLCSEMDESFQVEETSSASSLPKPPSHSVNYKDAYKWHNDNPALEAKRWLDLFSRSPRFLEIVRRYHQCHRPLKDGSFVNMDFPEYLAVKLYGKDLYKDIRRCIAFANTRKCELDCDPASALLEPGSFAAQKFNDWLKYKLSYKDPTAPVLDFDSWLFLEYDRLNRETPLALRRARERDNMREMYQNDCF